MGLHVYIINTESTKQKDLFWLLLFLNSLRSETHHNKRHLLPADVVLLRDFIYSMDIRAFQLSDETLLVLKFVYRSIFSESGQLTGRQVNINTVEGLNWLTSNSCVKHHGEGGLGDN